MADGVFKKVPVEIEITTGKLVEGVLNLPGSGYKTRLSDFVNNPSKQFIVLTNALISNEGKLEKKYHSIIIAKSAIIHIVELEQKED